MDSVISEPSKRDQVEVERKSDIVVVRRSGRDLKLDLFVPAGTAGPHPVVVWIHGGAFLQGDRKKMPERWEPLVSRGIAVASIEYRLSHEATFPAQLFDVRAAIRYLRAHGSELGLDTDALGLWGASAGGHLAALAGLLGDQDTLPGEGDVGGDVSVRAVAEAYGPSDMTASAPPPARATIPGVTAPSWLDRFLGGSPEELEELARAASPVMHVRRDAPPFQISHGTADELVSWRHSWNLHTALVVAGAESELFLLDGYRHGYINGVRRGDLDLEELLDGGRLAAEGAARAQWRHMAAVDDGTPTRFGFDDVASFFVRHLCAPVGGRHLTHSRDNTTRTSNCYVQDSR